ncbi:hypothetical protein PJ311_12975 [Bacillus sp. CLL-7-23]|uniref:Transposase n=1 Tax=Bacillus changyiensis TaxID=3004103 RepID=A0ABT4X5D1_9BACI|nr:hypothetical protein [Bacillus changyiensis]MDA7027500.1 hypothetical protein [Bacillus changyiensis]
MQRAHGIGYQEYSRRYTTRLEVEKKREIQYRESKQIISNMKMIG